MTATTNLTFDELYSEVMDPSQGCQTAEEAALEEMFDKLYEESMM